MANRRGVDVFIPCYNYGRFLRSAVECALAGADRPVRVLIVDDCSTDDTARIGAELAARYPDVSFRRHARNAGHIDTYNEGLAWAELEYFQFLSADDLLAPGALARGAAFLDAHPDVGLVYGRTRTFAGDAPADRVDATPFTSRVIDGIEFVRTSAEQGINPIPNPAAVLVRTDIQHRIGHYRGDLPHSGDMEMWFRFGIHAAIGYLDVEQGWYRRHSNNMSLGYRDVSDYQQKLMAFEAVCFRYADRIPEEAGILASARRSLAASAVWAAHDMLESNDDRSGVQPLVDFAVSVDPSVRNRPEFRRLALKRLLGRRVVRGVSSLVAVARGGRS